MNWIKLFFKELKRVRWPSAKESGKAYWISLVFIVIAALALFVVAIVLTQLWNRIGVS